MTEPVLLVVDDDVAGLGDIERELHDRYARHYRIVCVRSPQDARTCLEDFAATGVDVALVLAAQAFAGVTGSQVLGGVAGLHPHARRALLIEWSDWGQRAVGEAIHDGIARRTRRPSRAATLGITR